MNISSTLFKSEAQTPAPDPPVFAMEQRRYDANLGELHTIELELLDAVQSVAHYNTRNKDLRIALINNEVMTQLDAMRSDPVLQELEHRRDEILQRRNRILAEHAQLKITLGFTR